MNEVVDFGTDFSSIPSYTPDSKNYILNIVENVVDVLRLSLQLFDIV